MKTKWLLSIAFVMVSLPSVAFAQEFQEYVVKKGDTCTSIAREFYGDVHAYDNIHEHNDLSGQGYACTEGTKLKLPILPKSPEAKVTARAGNVRAKSPEASWQGVDVGAELFESWRVNTLEKSRAQLGFRDRSRLQMTENTLVVIYGPSQSKTKTTVSGRATVEKGRLKTRLADLSGAPLQVDTPSAIASLSNGSAQITVDENGESRVANHDGDSIKVSDPTGKKSVKVKTGYGSRVVKGAAPEKPRPLPPTPSWQDSFSPVVLTLGENKGTISASWNAVSKAKSYYVEITRDRRHLDVIASARVPSTVTNVELRDVPPGDYFVTIVSIDDAKFESIPSKAMKLRVAKLRVKPNYIVGEKTVLLGADVGAPSGMNCLVGGEQNTVLTQAGAQTVTCKRAELTSAMQIDVVAPTVSIEQKDIQLAQGAMRSIEIKFDPAVPPNTSARAAKGVDVKAVKVRSDALRLNLAASDQAEIGSNLVEIVFGDTVLNAVNVEVLSVDSQQTSGDAYSAPILLSVLAGYDAFTVDPYWNDEFPGAGAAFEIGLGAQPLDYFAGEVRLGFSMYSGDTTETVLNVRGQAMAGWLATSVAPYLGLGLNWRAWFDGDERVAIHGVFGVMPALSESWRLRIEGGAGVSPIEGDWKLLPEGRAGIVYLF